MFLSWSKVKNAKSYVVYAYDDASKDFKEAATCDGNDTNYYSVPINGDKVYKYKVQAKSESNGAGRNIGAMSYAVSAVAPDNVKSNVSEVSVDLDKTLKLKGGRKKTLKATVKVVNAEKEPYDRKVQWFSSNKKVVKINAKTGKLKATKLKLKIKKKLRKRSKKARKALKRKIAKLKSKKRTCNVWAMAHNGLCSKKIKVVVK